LLNVFTACTDELENFEAAYGDLKDCIERGGGLKANTAAIVTCTAEFIISGFSRYLSERLDFPFVGCSTSLTATDTGDYGAQFSMMILTSDTVRFRVGLTDPLSKPEGADWSEDDKRRNLDKSFLKLYRELTQGFGALPSLAMPFLPWLRGATDQLMGRVLFGPHEGLPFFGCKSADLYQVKRDSMPYIFCNGESGLDRAALFVAEQGLKPRFFVADTLRENINRRKAIITRSKGNVLYEVNDRPVIEFLNELGLEGRNLYVTLNTTPLVLFNRDQTSYHPRVFVDHVPEGGRIFNGDMPEGMSVGMAVLQEGAITETATSLFDKVSSLEDVKAMVFLSCMSRHLNLGWDEFCEVRLLQEAWKDRTEPWIFAYTGGEICPRIHDDSQVENAFIHFTAAAMAL
jgi:hypothetical protein